MKFIKNIKTKIGVSALGMTMLFACTSDFNELNTNPNGAAVLDNIGPLLTHAQQNVYAPSRFVCWRENVIFGSRFAEHWSFSFAGTWFGNGSGFRDRQDWHDGVWDDSYGLISAVSNNNIGDLSEILRLTDEGGQFESKPDHGVALIIRAMLLQKIADNYGALPVTDAGSGQSEISFDLSPEAYALMIDDLDRAMELIGSATDSGLGGADQVYGGDYQKWKRLANSEKLKIAMRTRNGSGNSFSAAAIAEAVGSPLMMDNTDGISVARDPNLEALRQGFANVWSFGTPAHWVMSKRLVEHLDGTELGTADPRLAQFAAPAINGGGYIGQEVALKSEVADLYNVDDFSKPNSVVYDDVNQLPSYVFNYADVEFLQAEAALYGLGGSDANGHFQAGIRASMEQWGVDAADITAFLASPAATLSGTTEEQFEQISVQRWIATYTYGAEAWAIVRRTGYPVIEDKTDLNKFADTSGWSENKMPQRLQYSVNSYTLNASEVARVVAEQGEDKMTTKLWWAK